MGERIHRSSTDHLARFDVRELLAGNLHRDERVGEDVRFNRDLVGFLLGEFLHSLFSPYGR